MTFQYLRAIANKFLNAAYHFVIFILLGADLYESKNIVSEFFSSLRHTVYFFITPEFFELFNAFYNGGDGHIYSFADSRSIHAGIVLKATDYFFVNTVECHMRFTSLK